MRLRGLDAHGLGVVADHRDDASADGEEGQAVAGGERIAKVLARAGVASRREIERLIEAGRVALNGETLRSPAVKVSAKDVVTLDGRPVAAAEPTRLFRYHKPPGLVTSHRDPQGRPTVFEALPPGLPRLISIGRLDLNSEGLLLLTNDGELARMLELPATGLQRRYRARARGRIDLGRLARLTNGITVDGVHYGPIEAEAEPGRDGAANQWISVSLTEGKNREVRKVLEALGLTVNRLIRVAYGPYALGSLEKGAVEELPAPVRGADGAFSLVVGKSGRRYKAKPAPPKRDGAPSVTAPLVVEGKKYKPGWAKAKVRPSGSRPAGARPAAPHAPKRGPHHGQESRLLVRQAPGRGAVQSGTGEALGEGEAPLRHGWPSRRRSPARGPGGRPCASCTDAERRGAGTVDGKTAQDHFQRLEARRSPAAAAGMRRRRREKMPTQVSGRPDRGDVATGDAQVCRRARVRSRCPCIAC